MPAAAPKPRRREGDVERAVDKDAGLATAHATSPVHDYIDQLSVALTRDDPYTIRGVDRWPGSVRLAMIVILPTLCWAAIWLILRQA